MTFLLIPVPRNQLCTLRSFHADFPVKNICHFVAFPGELFSLFCLPMFFCLLLSFASSTMFSISQIFHPILNAGSELHVRLLFCQVTTNYLAKAIIFASFTFQHLWLLKKEKVTIVSFEDVRESFLISSTERTAADLRSIVRFPVFSPEGMMLLKISKVTARFINHGNHHVRN